ncbi:MAG: DNA polymerase III subunit gamma/tau, partial [Akkermansiaceae bacterium]
VRTLRNAIDQNRLAHAYLFVGPRGTGKTSTARIFAKALNCTGGPKIDFDPEEDVCREIAEGRSLDVLEIDGASNNGVDQVRDLRDSVKYAPSRGQFKIYYIDEVHMLSNAAFNALLKTLEEPPDHVKFIFATTEVQKILPTILSRCQRFDLRPIPTQTIADHLLHIASAEGIKLDTTAAWAIAKGADGGMRDAQSMLDQLVAFCGESITEENVLDIFG